MRIIDNTSAGYRPMYIDVYRTHRDEIVAVAFSFQSYAEEYCKQVQHANAVRAERGITSFATRLYRIRIKKLKLVGEKP